MGSNGIIDDSHGGEKTEGFTNDEIYRLVAELKSSIDVLKQSIDDAIERSRTSDRNFEGRLEAVEGTLKAVGAKVHGDSQKLTVAVDKCFRATESLDAARLELSETTQHLRRIVAIIEKVNIGRGLPT
jgi:hypothetical protein